MTCAVCYTSMTDLAKDRKFQRNEDDHEEKLSVAHQCNKCLTILCHDCLTDWTVETVQNLHVPEAWNNIDILKLKCSSG